MVFVKLYHWYFMYINRLVISVQSSLHPSDKMRFEYTFTGKTILFSPIDLKFKILKKVVKHCHERFIISSEQILPHV